MKKIWEKFLEALPILWGLIFGLIVTVASLAFLGLLVKLLLWSLGVA